MKIRKTKIYDKFHCTADKCPENCCKSWRIHIDDETVQKYLEMKGLKGLYIRLWMHTDSFMPYFSRNSIRCPLLTVDRHCYIQRKIGEEYMPAICVRFPRDMRNYGEFAEYHLDPACPHAAELMLKNCSEPGFEVSDGTTDLSVFGNNDDIDFLHSLENSREKLLRIFTDAEPEGLTALDGAFKEALNIAFSDHEQSLSSINKTRKQEPDIKVFPLSGDILNEMMNSNVYKDKMLYYSPFCFSLFKLYFKYFDKLSPTGRQRMYDNMLSELLKNHPEITPHTFTYIRYSLEREYLTTFEDYSFIKRILDTLLCANIVLLLETVYFRRHKKMSVEIESRIITLCERRIRHNDVILKRLSDIFRFDSPDYFY